jgi:hypothetical protein
MCGLVGDPLTAYQDKEGAAGTTVNRAPAARATVADTAQLPRVEHRGGDGQQINSAVSFPAGASVAEDAMAGVVLARLGHARLGGNCLADAAVLRSEGGSMVGARWRRRSPATPQITSVSIPIQHPG